MKIAHINLLDDQGGAAKIAKDIIEGTGGLGYTSVLFAHRPSKVEKGIIPIPFLGGPYAKFLDRSNEYAIPGIHSSALLPVLLHPEFISADIVHLHCIDGGYFSYFLLPFLAVKPLIWTIHDTLSITAGCLYPQYCDNWKNKCCQDCPMEKKEKFAGAIKKRYLLQKAKDVVSQTTRFTAVAPSKWIESLLRQSAFKEQNIHMIYNSVHTDVFVASEKVKARKRLQLPPNKKIILFVAHGGLENYIKGGKHIIEMMNIAHEKGENWFLLEVGRDSDRGFQFPGKTVNYVNTEEEMALYYAAADVFVSASLSESFGLTVCEALSCGVPTVAFAAGGVTEIIENEKSGFLVPIGDVKQLYQRIHMIIKSKEIANYFSKNSQIRARALFSKNIMIKKYVELYDDIYRVNS